jgi:saccharopine dehydrogenase-like NADP-dependent oxidoreductase
MKVVGVRGEKRVVYDVLVRPHGSWTAMQIATGSVAVGMQYVIKDLEPGVTPPEYVGMSNRLFPRLLTAIKQRGVSVTQEVVERTAL